MMEGTLYFTEDGIAATVRPGEYYIQRRGRMQDSTVPSSGAVYYYIHFDGEYCDNSDALPLRGLWQRSEDTAHIARLDFLQSTGGTFVETESEFLAILSHLRRGEQETEHRRIVRELSACITENIRHSWSLSELSSHSGYSTNHLISIFRQETGQTPGAFLTNLRLHRARMLLLDSDMPLSRIAEECGFGGYVNFYKAFLKQNGCAPGEWKMNKRKEPK
jgi:AraC-like DNA-binding protein